MPLILNRREASYQIAVWHMQESLEALKAHPSAQPYVAQSSQFKSKQRQREWLATRILLYELLAEQVEIKYLPQGKPYLDESKYSIGISHSKEYVAIILSATQQVSIDLETPPYEQIHRVAARVFSPQELFFSPVDSAQYEPLLWCAKETLFKLVDLEGIDFRKDLLIHPFRLEPCAGSFKAEVYSKGSLYLEQLIQYYKSSAFIYTFALL